MKKYMAILPWISSPYLSQEPTKEKVIPYTDALFRDAAIQWLVETNQVCFILGYISCSDIGLQSQFRLSSICYSRIWLTLPHDLPVVWSFQTAKEPAPISSNCLNKTSPIYEIDLRLVPHSVFKTLDQLHGHCGTEKIEDRSHLPHLWCVAGQQRRCLFCCWSACYGSSCRIL